ncbi:hypothetical protein WMF45_01500 [Sorangium sp. So ce448]|uniref:hypothetical protein n=1 Tax=Sorangium sp. So ce448 TaxID=3133314 RepID=UPI003F624BE5
MGSVRWAIGCGSSARPRRPTTSQTGASKTDSVRRIRRKFRASCASSISRYGEEGVDPGV